MTVWIFDQISQPKYEHQLALAALCACSANNSLPRSIGLGHCSLGVPPRPCSSAYVVQYNNLINTQLPNTIYFLIIILLHCMHELMRLATH